MGTWTEHPLTLEEAKRRLREASSGGGITASPRPRSVLGRALGWSFAAGLLLGLSPRLRRLARGGARRLLGGPSL